MRCLWLAPLLAASFAMPAGADPPPPRLSQYAHSAWRIQDGALGSAPHAITQTADGYVWIGLSTGLVRFDGVRFVPWAPSDGASATPQTSIYSLLGGRDGSLWIGGSGRLSRLKDGHVTRYTKGAGRINAIVEDQRGAIWFTRTRVQDDTGPLCQVTDAEPRCYGTADGIAFRTGEPLVVDLEGTFWFGTASGLMRWRPRSSSAYVPPALQPASGLNGVTAIALAPDGSVWVGMIRSGPGLGLEQLQQGAWKPVAMPGLDGSSLAVTALAVDHGRAMWIGTENGGLYHVAGTQVDRFLRADGLTADSVTGFYEDREGNMWVVTPEGIDCFRKTPAISFSTREGLTANQAASVAAGRDGSVWIGNQGGLDVLRDRRVSSIVPRTGLPGVSITSLLEDHAGRVWVGVDNGLHVFEHATFRPILDRDGRALGIIRSLAEDRAGNIWAVSFTLGNPYRLRRIADFRVQEEIPANVLPGPYSVAADPGGGIWIGTSTADLARYRQGQLETFHFGGDGPSPSRFSVFQVVTTSDGSALGATPRGVVAWGHGGARMLTVRNGIPCPSVYGLVFDERGALWLYTQCGLVRIGATELLKWWTDRDAVVSPRVFDALDGVRPAAASFNPAASRSPDGRLWFANDAVVQMIDPANLAENIIPPTVHIEQLIADRQRHAATEVIQLPPLTRDVEIDYVGLSFVVPQKVQFRYRLEGRDAGWQESGTRRQAFYSDLRPGRYRFHVIASNNDGLWNDAGAALDFVIAPAWYQTKSFLVLSVVTGIVAIWLLFQLRMRQVARTLNARFDERLAERTRVARDLHDTLLQTVQGSKMVADAALSQSHDAVGMRHAMEQVSGWLGQATVEGRAAVNALRTPPVETNDLTDALRRAMEDCGRHGSLHASLEVTGEARELHPVVRDEVYRIGYEAIRNACMHSGGSRLAVALTYARDLTVRVFDNGVGIDPNVATSGRAGHFGLKGMQERAARIGATLTIQSSAGRGTEIIVTVPGRIIFRGQTAKLFERMRAPFTSLRRATRHDRPTPE